jgi:hypothetical protein
MKEEVSLSLEKTYKLVLQEIPHKQLDSLDVIRQVENYRQFWKPKKTSVILLAESHVYTDEIDFERELRKSIIQEILPNYPTRFVRFAYCLVLWVGSVFLMRAVTRLRGAWFSVNPRAFSAAKKSFQNQAGKRLCLAKETCLGLCSEPKTTHTAITKHS